MAGHTLPDLPYTYDALEPHVDARALKLAAGDQVMDRVVVILRAFDAEKRDAQERRPSQESQKRSPSIGTRRVNGHRHKDQEQDCQEAERPGSIHFSPSS